MKKVVIKIDGIYDISRFVDAASRVKEPGVTVRKGATILDGTSFIGMLSLNTKDGIIIEYSEKEVEFDKFIEEFKEK